MARPLLILLTIALTLGMLVVSAPAGAAQVVSSPTPTIAASPPASHGAGTTRGSLVMAIESPATDQQLHTDRDFLLVGYALDSSATPNQGAQGSGIDRVQLFMDDTPMADAELGFGDANAATFGSQFANSGFRLRFHPGDFKAGSHNLHVVALSAVSGQRVEMLYWISITTEADGHLARLVVESGGDVLDQDQGSQLAQPFRRLGADRTGSDRGSGLGLSIVEAIATAHGGTLELRARPEGGLRVVIALPLAPSGRLAGAGVPG